MVISDEALVSVTYVVFRILVPIIFIIGVLGNSLSIYVFTRKSMRCTANLYLTALAISDIGYLTMLFMTTFIHYDFPHYHTPIYYQVFGACQWILDACDFISIYVVLSFTIERFIAIRYPLKRQTLCTESMAKKVIAGVVIFGILFNMGEFFKYKLSAEYQLRDEDGYPCIQSFGGRSAASDPAKHMGNSMGFLNTVDGGGGGFTLATAESALHRLKRNLLPHQVEATTMSMIIPPSTTPTTFPAAELLTKLADSIVEPHVPPAVYWENEHKLEMIALDLSLTNLNEGCKNVTYYDFTDWILGDNVLYDTIWSYVSLIVSILLPTIVLAILNSFLVVMVRRSNALREKMTNASSMIKTKDKSVSAAVSQENRVTITLIAVVVCFFVFQTPYAVILFIQLLKLDLDGPLLLIIFNVCLFFAAINATTNFFIYSVLSDKFRKAVRELVIGKSSRQQRGAPTSSSVMTTDASRGSYRLAPTSPQHY